MITSTAQTQTQAQSQIHSKHNCLRFCLVTHRQNLPFAIYRHTLQQAIAGGVTSLQLREKNIADDDFLWLAHEVSALLHTHTTNTAHAARVTRPTFSAPIPLIINDRVDICLAVNAAGIHLGQRDMHPDQARHLLGTEKIIGLSIETLAELEAANKLNSIDYIAASAVFPTNNKINCKNFWQLTGLDYLCKNSRHPVIGIGGINAQNLHSVFQAGAHGVAVIGAIHDAPNPLSATQTMRQLIDQFAVEKIGENRTNIGQNK